MNLETERLVIRNFTQDDADDLYRIKYDEMVVEYVPTLIKRNANIEDIKEAITYFNSVEGTGDFEKQVLYAIVRKADTTIVGAIVVSLKGYLCEHSIGWMIQKQYCRQGYASEAAAAVTDYLFKCFGYEYIIVTMDVDNPASYRTAEKSGFKLFEKRTVYDHSYGRYGDDYYYFRKYNLDTKMTHQFYGDEKYDGRHA